MIYDLGNEIQKQQAITRFKYLLHKKKKIELTVKHPKKSVSHNAYAHLLFSWFAIEYGETIEHVKQIIFKRVVNPEIFKTEHINPKTGEIREDWKSFADIDSGQTTIAIDRFRNYSSKEAGIYLPEPNDLIFLEEIERQINLNKQFL